jgi:predicted nucleic acid-binding protein
VNVIDALAQHSDIGLDTMNFVYHLEASSSLSAVAAQALAVVESGTVRGITAETTIMELMVRPIQLGRLDIASDYERFLTSFPNLTIAPLQRVSMRRAAELRARHGLQALDALQIAACITSGATAFVTNDLRLRRVTDIDIIMLDDFVETH